MTLAEAPQKICAVVTDACCDMPAESLERLGVFACAAEPKVVELAELYRSLFEQGFSAIVSVHASTVVPAARTAAASVADAGAVNVVDTQLVSAALSLVVERAARAAADGLDAAAVAARAEEVAAETVFYVVSDPRAPRQGEGGLRDRLAYLRRRALATRHLVRITAEKHHVMMESAELSGIAGRVAQTLSACSRKKGALCYLDVASSNSDTLGQLEKPFDTNEYVSHHLSSFIPAPTLARYAGPDAVGVAVVPEAVYGGHSTSLFAESHTERKDSI